MNKKDILPVEFIDIQDSSISLRDIKGIGRALDEYKKGVLKLYKMPISADCAQEIIDAEKSFRKALTTDILTLIEMNCAQCPVGFERNDCKAKSCPFSTIESILKTRLNELNQILPGGI